MTREEKKKKSAAYYQANRERILARNNTWHARHRERSREISAKYRKANPEKTNAAVKKCARANRDAAIRAYGGYHCACPGCDVTTPEFLGIDHIEGGGCKQREKLFGSKYAAGSPFYRWLKKNNYPPGFQVLCHNCNLSKGFYGACPHANVLKLMLKNFSSDPVGELERGRVNESCLSDNTASSDLSFPDDHVRSICGKGV